MTDPSVLASWMLDWEKAKREATRLEIWIERAILEQEKTQVVGNVRATYNTGRKTYDYALAGAREADPELIAKHTTIPEPKIAWRLVCKEAEIENVPFEQADPSVTLKLEG